MPRACPVESSRSQLTPDKKPKTGCHGLAPWRAHARSYLSSEREAPRRKAVASKPFENCLGSSDPETPRGKPVVSAKRGVSTRQARGICCDRETPRDKRVGTTANVAVRCHKFSTNLLHNNNS